jgi:hypothetical protein
MPLTGLTAPNNCWPYAIQRFADALIASAQFRTMVELAAESEDAEIGAFVFGKRMTHSRNGRTWTKDELAQLRHFASVYGFTFGKHRTPSTAMRPHGETSVYLSRLIPEANLVDNGDGLKPTDEHDREWENIVGTTVDQVVAWMAEEGGVWPINSWDVTDDSETRSQVKSQQGTWQQVEISFQWGREQ